MAYQALYRVWRSQRFEDIVGQKAITQTLKNAIITQKTSHAYLFTGPRGTGKTSAAKIFAKAINCPNRVDGEPCNDCEMCRSITEGTQEDVIEIDAASNNGVEEIRFIRDRANYAPTKAAYKIYIIDEVHMLSTGAFNALLKTLEEPKQHVIFILATTEPHKIPATIISRTQRFDFKRIQTKDIVDHLRFILEKTDIRYEEEALTVVARAAEGGMRDALSIMDQAISFSSEIVTHADALQVTGSLTTEMMDLFLSACLKQDVSQALHALETMLAEGKEARRLIEDLLIYCRDLLMYQQAPSYVEETGGERTLVFGQLAQAFSADTLFQLIQILSDTQNEIRYTNHATVYLEVATVKLAQISQRPVGKQTSGPAELAEIQSLQNQLQDIKKELKQLKKIGQGAKEALASETPAPKPKTSSSFRLPTERVFQVLTDATRQDLNNIKNVWDDLLHSVTVTQRAMLKASEPVAASPSSMIIAFDYEIVCQRATNDLELQETIQNNLSRMISNYSPALVMITKESWPNVRKSFLQQAKQQGQAADFGQMDEEEELFVPEKQDETEELVEKAHELFGSEIVKIVND